MALQDFLHISACLWINSGVILSIRDNPDEHSVDILYVSGIVQSYYDRDRKVILDIINTLSVGEAPRRFEPYLSTPTRQSVVDVDTGFKGNA